MEYILAIQSLTERLEEYEKALTKSTYSYHRKEIDQETHEIHKRNLIPKIKEFRNAIEKLKQ